MHCTLLTCVDLPATGGIGVPRLTDSLESCCPSGAGRAQQPELGGSGIFLLGCSSSFDAASALIISSWPMQVSKVL